MATHPDYPGVSSFKDRHGKLRWRFRKTGLKPVALPGEPHTKPFDDAHQAAIEGRIAPKPSAEIVQMPGAAHPASLNAAWRKLRETAKWKKLSDDSKDIYTRYLEEFLRKPNGKLTMGDGPCADFRPRHVAQALDDWSDTPHKARILLTMLQKIMKIAVREDWIEYNPTHDVDRPDTTTKGKVAWPPHVCARFEAFWKIGTQPRTAYELAKWLGTRCSDVASIRWDQQVTKIVDGEAVEGFEFVQFKGRNRKGAFAKFHPISPMLVLALAPLSRDTKTVLVKENGDPYLIKSMPKMMRHWIALAGIEKGYSFHGLRHAMGARLVDAGATPHQVRDVLGHATITEQDKYTKQRNQARTATEGMKAVVRLVNG